MPKLRIFLISISAKWQVFTILVMTVLSAFVIAFTAGLLFHRPELTENIDLTTAVYQVLGTLYAVLLAFVVSGVWQNFSKAALSVQAEANALSDLVHLANSSAISNQHDIRSMALLYSKVVVEDEWHVLGMQHGDVLDIHEISRDSSNTLTDAVLSFQPENNHDTVVFGQALTLLSNWLDARRTRILMARGNSAKALWPLLITGAIILFSFHGLFYVRAPELWALVLLAMSLIVGVCFYLIFSLDCPYTGKPFVDSEPFKWAISWFEKSTLDPKSIL